MAAAKKRINFLDSEEATEVEHSLRLMAEDSTYNTAPSYSANTVQYPYHSIPFVDKHMSYLSKHPSVDPSHYLANLRLMTRIR